MAALRASRQERDRAARFEPTWTGRSGAAGAPPSRPLFGARAPAAPAPAATPAVAAVTPTVAGPAAPLSSRLLLNALRQRAVEVESDGDDGNDETPADGARPSGALGTARVSVNLDRDSDQADGDNSSDEIDVDGSGPGATCGRFRGGSEEREGKGGKGGVDWGFEPLTSLWGRCTESRVGWPRGAAWGRRAAPTHRQAGRLPDPSPRSHVGRGTTREGLGTDQCPAP